MKAEYRWCLRCRRAYPVRQVRRLQGRKRCVHAGCAGLYPATVDWTYLRLMAPEGERLPTVPVAGEVYPFQVWDGEIRRSAPSRPRSRRLPAMSPVPHRG